MRLAVEGLGRDKVINFVTVHWRSSKWIATQLRYVGLCTKAPYRVFASFTAIDDPSLKDGFYYVREDEIDDHPEKLNILSQVVVEQSQADDIIVFLDGDAFPIQPLHPWLEETLRTHPLTAVQRRENLGDLRPHPSFCAATVGFWKELGCDWSREEWITPSGHLLTDAGGRLASLLRSNGVDWLPLVRTNTDDLHPLWYAVYGHRIYHHGAGFRQRVSRVDQVQRPALDKVDSQWDGPSLGQLAVSLRKDPSQLRRVKPSEVAQAARRTSLRRLTKRFKAKADTHSEEIFERIQADPCFYRAFDHTLS